MMRSMRGSSPFGSSGGGLNSYLSQPMFMPEPMPMPGQPIPGKDFGPMPTTDRAGMPIVYPGPASAPKGPRSPMGRKGPGRFSGATGQLGTTQPAGVPPTIFRPIDWNDPNLPIYTQQQEFENRMRAGEPAMLSPQHLQQQSPPIQQILSMLPYLLQLRQPQMQSAPQSTSLLNYLRQQQVPNFWSAPRMNPLLQLMMQRGRFI